jgi:hypothetical protein
LLNYIVVLEAGLAERDEKIRKPTELLEEGKRIIERYLV